MSTGDLVRLHALRALLNRWIGEYPAILDADPPRALHHLEAIADLRLLIALVESGIDTARHSTVVSDGDVATSEREPAASSTGHVRSLDRDSTTGGDDPDE